MSTRIYVCIRPSPPVWEAYYSRSRRVVDTSELEWGLGPDAQAALGLAQTAKALVPAAEVTAVSWCDGAHGDLLKEALAKGAGRVVRVLPEPQEAQGLDAVVVGSVLASAITALDTQEAQEQGTAEGIERTFIICGAPRTRSGRGSSLVGYTLAAALGWPVIADINGDDLSPDLLQVDAAVFCAAHDSASPKKPTMMALARAMRGEVEEIEVEPPSARLRVRGFETTENRHRAGEVLSRQDQLGEALDALYARLREGRVI